MTTTLLLVDDHPVFRKGLHALLEEEQDMRVAGQAGDGQTAIALARDLSPDVVVMDISMPHLDGIEATRRILAQSPGVKVVALSIHGEKRYVENMLRAGARGYILKESVPEELVNGIRTVAGGEIYLSAAITDVVVSRYMDLLSAEPGQSDNGESGEGSGQASAGRIVTTKLHRPSLTADFVLRDRLLERLNRGVRRSLTLVSAPAGYGKSTLISHWLETLDRPGAWLSLAESDDDLIIFLSYFVAAIRTLFSEGCPTTYSLLTAAQTPPPDYLAATLINEIGDLSGEFLLVLDDYHLIGQPDIHQVVAELIQQAPPSLHLVLVTRQDPPFSIARLRASEAMTEIRLDDLRFTSEEIRSYLKRLLGGEVSPETVTVLARRTEGWAVGLRMACLALRGRADSAGFLETFQGTDRYIMEYLVDEVLAQQPQPIQTFLLRTSILDRFCAPLGDALLGDTGSGRASEPEGATSRDILARLEKANLFIIALDQQGRWFRYHHLFQQLLAHKLTAETPETRLADFHLAAGGWLEQNGFIEEALRHYFDANDTASAARLLARRRYALLNRTEWPRLEQLLHHFLPNVLDQYPDLLMLKTWLIYHRGQYAELPAALQRLEAALAQASLAPEAIKHLEGEMSALRSLMFLHADDPKNTLAQARQALEESPRPLWIVRVLARICQAVALQMMGDTHRAYAAIYRGFEEEETQSNAFKATLVMTACHLHWMDADLPGMAQAARQCITLSQDSDLPQILNHGYYHLGRVCYQQNDLAAAEQHFGVVVQQPYLNYGDIFAYSACGLAATYRAQGRPDEARAVLEAAGAFMLETGNTTLMPVIQAFQAEIALRQGQIAAAGRWAAMLDPIPPLRPIYEFFSPHLTLVKIWLAQDTTARRQQAAGLLAKLRDFLETTHNIRFLIETLALEALLYQAEGDRPDALAALEQVISLAQPGGFIRLFVDLGPPMAGLLAGLKTDDSGRQQYIAQILAAFPDDLRFTISDLRLEEEIENRQSKIENLIEPLTNREQEVLELLAQRLSDKEIARRLFISPHTVKTHIKSIFGKLNVGNRRQAVARAQELGLLPPE